MVKRSQLIYGKHSVLEAIASGNSVEKIFLARKSPDKTISSILRMAGDRFIPVQRVPREKIQRLLGGDQDVNHQGIIALQSPISYYLLEDVVMHVYENGETPFFMLLDGVTDVRNLGAIARTAEGFGVHGLVVPKSGTAQITPAAIKTSAGALTRLPVCRIDTLKKAIGQLKLHGVQVFATESDAETSLNKLDLTVPLAMVLGAEDIGVSQEVEALCDKTCHIPMRGKVDSFNVSVSAGIIAYEVIRQRSDQA